METGIQLRDYQETLINDLRKSMKGDNKRIIMQLGTGGGKTVCFTYMVKTASERNRKCMILTDRVALLEQAGGTFDKFGLAHSTITAETKTIPRHCVIVAMSETIKRRCDKRLDYQMLLSNIDLLIIDEAHKATFNKVFKYLNPSCIVIGATATPISANPKTPLIDYYNTIVQGHSIEWMIENNYLAKPLYSRKKLANFDGLKKKGKDFDNAKLEEIYTDVKVFDGLKEAKTNLFGGRKTIIFCSNVQVSRQVADELDCLHVDGYMAIHERESIMYDFENDPHGVISNVDILTTGYDHPPAVNIVLYRDTLSLPLYLQMCGRGSRMCEGKTKFYIYDFGRNIERFGYWHSERIWKLEKSTPSKKRDKLDIFPVKDCPECECLIPKSSKKCPECGYVFPVSEAEKVKVELEMISFDEIKAKLNNENTSISEKESIRKAKGYKIGFLLRQFKSVADFEEYANLKGYKRGWVQRQVSFYENNLT